MDFRSRSKDCKEGHMDWVLIIFRSMTPKYGVDPIRTPHGDRRDMDFTLKVSIIYDTTQYVAYF